MALEGIAGGAGKTAVATNLAAMCATEGQDVFLVDAGSRDKGRIIRSIGVYSMVSQQAFRPHRYALRLWFYTTALDPLQGSLCLPGNNH